MGRSNSTFSRSTNKVNGPSCGIARRRTELPTAGVLNSPLLKSTSRSGASWPRGGSAPAARPIDIRDAVGYLIEVRENPRTAGGEFDIGEAGRNSPPRVADRSPDRLRPVSMARMSSAAPTHRTGVEEQPAEGGWRNCSPGRLSSGLSAGCQHFHGGTGSRNGGRGIAAEGGGEQFPGPVASRLPPAGLRARWPDARTPAGEGAVEGMATGATPSCGRILLPLRALAPQVAAALARQGTPGARPLRKTVRPQRKATEWARWFQ